MPRLRAASPRPRDGEGQARPLEVLRLWIVVRLWAWRGSPGKLPLPTASMRLLWHGSMALFKNLNKKC